MHKGIIVYIIIFVLLVAVVFIFFRPKGIGPATTTASTIRPPATTINQSTSASTTSSQSTTIVYGSCISGNVNASIRNGNFSTGTYANWSTQSYGFGTAPLNLTYANQNHGYYSAPWSGYAGTYAAATYHGGLSLEPGNLTSDPFLVVEPFLDFKLISPPNANLYIEVLQNSKPVTITHFNTYAAFSNASKATSTFVNASIPLGMVMCQNVTIKIVANIVGTITTHSDYIAAGDFYMSRVPVQAPGIVANQTIV